MRIVAVFLILFLLAAGVSWTAQTAAAQESGGERIRSAGSEGMAYGSVLISIVIIIAVPSMLLLLIVKIVGIEEVGILRCVYTTLIYFAVVALVFYTAAELEKGLANPLEVFNTTGMMVRLAIVLGVAFLLVRFMLSGTLVRSLIGAVLYVLAFYGAAHLAYTVIRAAGGQSLFGSGTTGS